MKAAWQDFRMRVNEVDSYLEFLDHVSASTSTSVRYTGGRTQKYYTISPDLKILLRANAFLLLYNLVEASVVSALRAIVDVIADDGVPYADVSGHIQRVWLDGTLAGVREVSFEKLRNEFEAMIQSALGVLPLPLSVEHLRRGIPGNLDAARIRRLAQKIGFSAAAGKGVKGGADLEIIKQNRNYLAHGEKSFYECGRDYTLADLHDMRNQVVKYLERILANVERYIETQQFRVQRTA